MLRCSSELLNPYQEQKESCIEKEFAAAAAASNSWILLITVVMHRLPKIFGRSSNRLESGQGSICGSSSSASRVAGKAKRLDRLNARKNIDYDYSACSASDSSLFSLYSNEESLHSRLLDLYDGKTSFRIDGVDGEFEMLCERLGFSGIDDFAIPIEEYEVMKVRSSFAPAVFIQNNEHLIGREFEVNCDEVVELAADSGDGGGSVDAICREIEGNNVCGELAENRDDLIRENCKEGRDFVIMSGNKAKLVDARLGDNARTSDEMSSANVSERYNQLRGNGIEGVRAPVLVPPPLVLSPEVDKDCSTWDIFRAFTPDSDTSTLRFEYGFCFDEECDCERNEDDDHGEDRRARVLGRQESYNFSSSSSFNTRLNDDDSSSTTTYPMSSISPNGRFRRIISEWQKGELLGSGSFGSVYEGISDDGFFFAVKEVSLLDQGDKGKQRIIQLEQEIALLSHFEHENIVQYYGTRKDESHLYIFLELVTKGSLLSLYQIYNFRDSQVSAYTRQILHGLKYLHDRNVVHRDVKCANILVDANGLVKLADFGLAKATKLNDVNSCKGTAFWMAPEVVQNRGYGLAADIWSLGCTVLEMLTRQFPYYDLECMQALFKIGMGERPPIPDSIFGDAHDFIVRCLQVNPSLRPTAAQLLNHPFVQQPLPSCSGFASPRYFYQ